MFGSKPAETLPKKRTCFTQVVKYLENNNFQLLSESQACYYRKSMVSGTHHRELKILVMAGDFTAPMFQMWIVGSHGVTTPTFITCSGCCSFLPYIFLPAFFSFYVNDRLG